MTEISMFILR